MEIYREISSFSPFSPLIDISSPSSLRHITYGSGKPLALHVRVTFVPSRTTISLLVIDSMMTGGTESAEIVGWVPSLKLSKHLMLTHNLQISFPRSHGISVHLTHVPPSIRLLDLPDVQVPASVVVVSQYDARVLGDNIVMNAEDGLRVYAHPRDLRAPGNNLKWNLQHWITARRKCLNLKPRIPSNSIRLTQSVLFFFRLSFRASFYTQHKKLENQITLGSFHVRSSRERKQAKENWSRNDIKMSNRNASESTEETKTNKEKL